MEMCYNGALVMPSSYAVVNDNEMEYVQGGTAANFCNNLQGLWNKTQILRWAMRDSGMTWGYILSTCKMSYWYVMANVSAKVAGIIAIGSRVLAVVAFLGAIAATTYIWNKRIWY